MPYRMLLNVHGSTVLIVALRVVDVSSCKWTPQCMLAFKGRECVVIRISLYHHLLAIVIVARMIDRGEYRQR